MDTGTAAQKVLREAEAALQGLIEAAAREQRYDEVADLAATAAALADLLKIGTALPAASSSKPRAAAASAGVAKHQGGKGRKRRTRSIKQQYPKFRRDGERLVKIGWSKKNREEYEHRAPKQAVIAVVRHLAESMAPGKVFPMEDLGSVHDRADGDQEVPTYQVYLVFAWLRHAGVVEKHGRDGYELVGDGVDENGIQELWEQLPPKRP